RTRVRGDLPQPGAVAAGVGTASPARGLAVAEPGGEPGGGGHPAGSSLLGGASVEVGRAERCRGPGLLAACLPPAARAGPPPGDRPRGRAAARPTPGTRTPPPSGSAVTFSRRQGGRGCAAATATLGGEGPDTPRRCSVRPQLPGRTPAGPHRAPHRLLVGRPPGPPVVRPGRELLFHAAAARRQRLPPGH